MKALNGFLLLLCAHSLCDPNARCQFTALTLNLPKKGFKNPFMIYKHEPAIAPMVGVPLVELCTAWADR